MGILEELLAGGQRQREYSDFVERYEQGHPSQGYSDQEVLERYGEVSHAVPSDQYAQAAQEALSKLSPEERAAFVKMLQDRAAARGLTLPGKVLQHALTSGLVLVVAQLKTEPFARLTVEQDDRFNVQKVIRGAETGTQVVDPEKSDPPLRLQEVGRC